MNKKIIFFTIFILLHSLWSFNRYNVKTYSTIKLNPYLALTLKKPAKTKSKEKKDKILSFLRRSEIVFFIALPFTILYNKKLTESMTGKAKVTIIKNKENFPNYEKAYIVINSILWSTTITFNNVYEHLSETHKENFTKEIDSYRFTLNFLRRNF